VQEILNKLKHDFGYGPLVIRKDGWFLLETTPLPPKDQLLNVIADICNGRPVHIEDNSLNHSDNCTDNEHILPKKDRQTILEAVEALTEQKFSCGYFGIKFGWRHEKSKNLVYGLVLVLLHWPENFILYC